MTTLKFIRDIISRLNWKIFPTTSLSIINCIAIIPCILWLPAKYALENSFFENLQVVILALSVIFALCNKNHKYLFRWFAMLSFILFLREINCGRIFFPHEGMTASFKTWAEILPNHSRLPNTLYALFMIFTLVYFFIHRLYKTLWQYVKFAKFPAIDILLFMLGIVLGTLGETLLPNEMFEEVSETMFYLSFMSIIYLYTFNPIFKLVIKKKK